MFIQPYKVDMKLIFPDQKPKFFFVTFNDCLKWVLDAILMYFS